LLRENRRRPRGRLGQGDAAGRRAGGLIAEIHMAGEPIGPALEMLSGLAFSSGIWGSAAAVTGQAQAADPSRIPLTRPISVSSRSTAGAHDQEPDQSPGFLRKF
jgi:hypothetical protein